MYKFSLIIPSYNIESFHKVFFENMKFISSKVDVIFINDCSTDGTKQLLEEFIDGKENMRLFNHEKNAGPGGAVNTGIKHMKTKWYFRIDPDDIIHENYEECIVKSIEENPNAKLIRYKFLYNTPNVVKKPNILESLYFKISFGWSCGFNIEKFGKPIYKSNFKMEDMEMFARQYLKTNDKEVFINEYLVSYTTSREDSTMNSIDLDTLQNWKYAFKIFRRNKSIKGLHNFLYKINVRHKIRKYSKIHKIRPTLVKIIYHSLVKFFIKTKPKIIFAAFDNTTKGMNEIVLFNEMYNRFSDKYEFIWLANHNNMNLPKDVKVFHPNSFGAMRHAASASHFISGTYTKIPTLKRKIQIVYLNHGYSVKTMGHDWVDGVSGLEKLFRKIIHNNQLKQMDKAFFYDEFDKNYMSRVLSHKRGKKTEYIINGFPVAKKFNTGNDVLFLPSWHENKEIVFPKISGENKYVSFHPKTSNVTPPEGWTIIKSKDREKLNLKYVFSDNSSSPIDYIKSGIQVYWIKGEYDRDFCREFKEKYSDLIIDPNSFKPLSKTKYNEIVKDILEAPINDEAIDVTIRNLDL